MDQFGLVRDKAQNQSKYFSPILLGLYLNIEPA